MKIGRLKFNVIRSWEFQSFDRCIGYCQTIYYWIKNGLQDLRYEFIADRNFSLISRIPQVNPYWIKVNTRLTRVKIVFVNHPDDLFVFFSRPAWMAQWQRRWNSHLVQYTKQAQINDGIPS